MRGKKTTPSQDRATYQNPPNNNYIHSLTLSLSRTLTLSLTHTHSLSLTHTHTFSLTHTHTLSLTHTHTLSHTHTLTHTHTHTLTHTHTHTHTHTLSHTHTAAKVKCQSTGVTGGRTLPLIISHVVPKHVEQIHLTLSTKTYYLNFILSQLSLLQLSVSLLLHNQTNHFLVLKGND
ncbi:hypothetical protein Q7C36_017656 [Tachysurus vachellii]|uniref:Uncharacterized protein n=1 Tax=Tachysurus vachellii TaxID=175792 RepID=A0AA88M3P5_TACVA|nr:hypothetical protein Q7C36_017656 [Tachysurus vachellii]